MHPEMGFPDNMVHSERAWRPLSGSEAHCRLIYPIFSSPIYPLCLCNRRPIDSHSTLFIHLIVKHDTLSGLCWFSISCRRPPVRIQTYSLQTYNQTHAEWISNSMLCQQWEWASMLAPDAWQDFMGPKTRAFHAVGVLETPPANQCVCVPAVVWNPTIGDFQKRKFFNIL